MNLMKKFQMMSILQFSNISFTYLILLEIFTFLFIVIQNTNTLYKRLSKKKKYRLFSKEKLLFWFPHLLYLESFNPSYGIFHTYTTRPLEIGNIFIRFSPLCCRVFFTDFNIIWLFQWVTSFPLYLMSEIDLKNIIPM